MVYEATFNDTDTMTKTYAQVMKQIDDLSREAERLKRKEVDGVIPRIREAIEATD